MAHAHPFDQIADDHGALSMLVFGILNEIEGEKEPPQPVAQEALRTQLIELREQLMAHFDREEEGLFPFICEHFPPAKERVDAMTAAHEGICSGVAAMARLAEDRPEAFAKHLPTIKEGFTRFLDAYVEHSRMETELLQELSDRLDPTQCEALDELIRSL